ncbi:MAG TPA: RidA family protein [Ilumatobacter sp.]|jgi:enamine deaminase RidA (YjgF/YER057c/UK114 family)|nr:RidA family protein [Ilumatobacter sp.]
MVAHDLLHPQGWRPALGYSNGVAASGRMVFLAGMIGWNAEQEFESDDFIEQAAQALRNIVAVLAEGGARPEHLVRLTWFVTDRNEYVANQRGLGAAYREIIGKRFPAMTLVQVVALVEPRAKVEIEATAVVPL